MKRRTAIAGGLFLVFLMFLWWGSVTAPEDERPAVVSSERRPDVARRREAEGAAPRGEEESYWEHEHVVLYLREAREGLLMVPRSAELDPGRLWDVDEPDVVLLETAWAEAADRYEEVWLEALEQLDDNEVIAPAELVGPPPVDGLLDLAEQVAVAHDGDPVADVADLFRLDALRAIGDDDSARELAIDLVLRADDDVAGQAAGLLNRLPRGEPLDGTVLDRLADLVDEAPDLTETLDVAALGLDHALRSGDESRAQDWVLRLEGVVDTECDRAQVFENARCAANVANVDDTLGRLGLRDPLDADDWRQAMEIAAFACERELRPGPMMLDGQARFSGGWAFSPWAPSDTAFTACLQQEMQSGPVPDQERLDVSIRVLSPLSGG